MFTNATLYRITQLPAPDFKVVEALEAKAFTPCGPTQEISHGWIAPRGDGESLCECINGNLIYKLMTETKTVPAEILDRALTERCKAVEDATGRKPGKKERRELKDEVRLDLLPKAFPKRIATLAWINPEQHLLVVDTASQKRADEVAMLLIDASEGLVVQHMTTNQHPSNVMAAWLSQVSLPDTLGIDMDCVLGSTDESKTKVKYVKHNLDIPEIKEHIQKGMLPESLSLTWLNRIAFTLSNDLTLKNIMLLDNPLRDTEEEVDEFDASVCIMTGELISLVNDLAEELGGEITQPA